MFLIFLEKEKEENILLFSVQRKNRIVFFYSRSENSGLRYTYDLVSGRVNSRSACDKISLMAPDRVRDPLKARE